jgi:phage terminase large subunit
MPKKLILEEDKEITKVYIKNLSEFLKKENRIIVNEGGTGSGKTVALAQLFITILLRERGGKLTIARKTFPALRATAMKDFYDQLKRFGLYREENRNKSEHTYIMRGNELDFVSVDSPIKIRSRRRNYLWLNEANEFTKEDYMQLSMRTDKQIFMDYNPSDQYHWIYDDIQTRKDCAIIRSTYKDNPFLPDELVKEIESWQGHDENYWKVYGLGLRGVSQNTIYTKYFLCDSIPEGAEIIYGLDFGFNVPTALVRIGIKDKECYIQELIYERGLTNQNLIGKLKELEIDGLIYADSAEPNRIEEISQAGFSIMSANKDVSKGIDTLKTIKKYITKESVNVLKEIKNYRYKVDKNGLMLDEPVKINDHGMDAIRYAVHTHLNQPIPSFEWL